MASPPGVGKGSIMVLIIVAVVLAAIVIVISTKKELKSPQKYTTMSCPTCGGEAQVYDDSWECPWCGDFGSLR